MLFYLKHVTRTEQKKKKTNEQTLSTRVILKNQKEKKFNCRTKKKKSNEIVFWTVVLAQSEQMSRIGDVSG